MPLLHTAVDAATTSVFGALNRYVRPAVKSGLFGPLPVGVGLVVLETTGRTTGLRREVPLVAARIGRRVTVSTGRANSQWVRNLEHDDAPAVWVGGRRRETSASVRRGPVSVAALRTVS